MPLFGTLSIMPMEDLLQWLGSTRRRLQAAQETLEQAFGALASAAR